MGWHETGFWLPRSDISYCNKLPSQHDTSTIHIISHGYITPEAGNVRLLIPAKHLGIWYVKLFRITSIYVTNPIFGIIPKPTKDENTTLSSDMILVVVHHKAFPTVHYPSNDTGYWYRRRDWYWSMVYLIWWSSTNRKALTLKPA